MNDTNHTPPPADEPVDRRFDEYDTLAQMWRGDGRSYPSPRMALPDERHYQRHITDTAKWLNVAERDLAYTVELRQARVDGNRRNQGAA